MIYKKFTLFPDRPWVTLEYYGNELAGGPRDAMLVIPGGGYSCVCADREGGPIALAYLLQGMNAFVLHYSVHDQIKEPYQPLEEASAAMIFIREHAKEFDVNPERVFAVGFSAGGHLAAWLGCGWDKPRIRALLPDKGEKNRPTGVVLCYAVITNVDGKPEDSFNKLYSGKKELTDEELHEVCLENHVDGHTSPAFILHTFDDERVPVQNALAIAQAYAEAGVSFEMHVYPHAPHGVALGTGVTAMGHDSYDNAAIARWVADSAVWMKGIR